MSCESSCATATVTEVRRRVHFSPIVRVVLVPTVAEYREVGLDMVMWWAENNYRDFKASAISDLRQHLMVHNQMDYREAINDMYQLKADPVEEPAVPTPSATQMI